MKAVILVVTQLWMAVMLLRVLVAHLRVVLAWVGVVRVAIHRIHRQGGERVEDKLQQFPSSQHNYIQTL